MNLKGVSYINRIKATLPHLAPQFTDEQILKARFTLPVDALFKRTKPQDEEEKDQLVRAFLREQYILDPKNK